MSLDQLTEFSLKTKKADSFSTVETSNSENVESFIESKKIKRVSFSRVEIVKIQKYKKYNKPFIKSISQEGEEDTDCGCQCFIF